MNQEIRVSEPTSDGAALPAGHIPPMLLLIHARSRKSLYLAWPVAPPRPCWADAFRKIERFAAPRFSPGLSDRSQAPRPSARGAD